MKSKWKSVCVSIRQHTSAYMSKASEIRQSVTCSNQKKNELQAQKRSECPFITNLSHLSLSLSLSSSRALALASPSPSLSLSLSLALCLFLSFSLSHSTDRLACGHHVVELLYFHLNSRRIPPILWHQTIMQNRRLKRKISISIDPHAPMAQRSRPARCLDSLHSTCLHSDPPASTNDEFHIWHPLSNM